MADDGTWSFPAHVPLATLEYGFAIRQSAFGRTETSDRFTVPADTFRDVTVDPTPVSAGAVNAFNGTATPGAEYRVVNTSGTEIVTGGPFSLDERGRWTFRRVVSNGATEFRFVIEQATIGSSHRAGCSRSGLGRDAYGYTPFAICRLYLGHR